MNLCEEIKVYQSGEPNFPYSATKVNLVVTRFTSDRKPDGTLAEEVVQEVTTTTELEEFTVKPQLPKPGAYHVKVLVENHFGRSENMGTTIVKYEGGCIKE
ncbi:MAG: hypothetical protein ACOCXT_01375 [Candidatus Dojkabacteria bacterium]